MSSNWTCLDCGTEASKGTKIGGSFAGELLLWAALAVVSLLSGLWWLMLGALGYSIWRLTSKRAACTRCDSARIVPSDTPAAAEMRARTARQ